MNAASSSHIDNAIRKALTQLPVLASRKTSLSAFPLFLAACPPESMGGANYLSTVCDALRQ
jgi:hypothetical protein